MFKSRIIDQKLIVGNCRFGKVNSSKTGQGRELAGARLQLKNRQIVADHDGAQPRETSSDEIITL